MKKILAFLYLCCLTSSWSQPLPEPLKSKYLHAKSSQQKAEILIDIIRPSSADSTRLAKMIVLRDWFKKNNDPTGANYAELYIAAVFMFRGDSNVALKMVLPLLKKFEQENDAYGKMRCYHTIGMSYSLTNFDVGFDYLKKAIAIATTNHYEKFLTILYNDTGVAYFEAGLPEQGLNYAQKALWLDTKNNDLVRLPVSLSTVGENYMAFHSYDLAMPFLRRSLYLDRKNNRNTYIDVYLHNDLAQAFLGLKQLDSALYYANHAVKKSIALDYKEQRLRSYNYLISIFKQTHNQDSLNKYYPLLIATKDELFSVSKLRSLENVNFTEQLRQREIEAEKLKAEEERHHVIQYAMIATGIITFFIFFLLLSRTVMVNEKWISFLAILALLLVFEFVNLLIHPFLGTLTHHSPIWMLICMVALASLLIPLHHRLEHFIKHKLTEKNKSIRLAAAKKTIEQLESN